MVIYIFSSIYTTQKSIYFLIELMPLNNYFFFQKLKYS